MDYRLRLVRVITAVTVLALVPIAVLAARSRIFTALAVLDTAVLAIATAYAVYLGLYRYPR